MNTRRQRLGDARSEAGGKTRGYLTLSQEISDPPARRGWVGMPKRWKSRISMLNDMGVLPVLRADSRCGNLLLNSTGQSATTEEEAEEEARDGSVHRPTR